MTASDAPSSPIALVTGATHGLGLAVAQQLSAQGMRVVIAGRDARRSAEVAAGIDGAIALPVPLDIGDQDSVDAYAAAFDQQPGRLDVLINNAAVRPDVTETPTSADLAVSADHLRVNLYGPWRTVQAFLPLLRRAPHPRVVTVGSGAGSHTDPQYGMAVNHGTAATHAVGKAAVGALMSLLAAELADTPVVVNTVCPGVVTSHPGPHPEGARSPEEAAPGVVWAATLPDDGPRGGFFRDGRPLGW